MSSITKNWTEEDFRKELRRLDQKVKKEQGIELLGAALDIEFSRAQGTLGVYYPKEKKFRFSLRFFNSDVPEECAIDVIRHEYAHYYNDVVFGINHGHGAQFKVSCQIVGALPSTYYSREYESLSRKKEEWAVREYKSEIKIGQQIYHPLFGAGVVSAIDNKKDSALLTIDFADKGVRIIDENWLKKKGLINGSV